MKKYRHFCHKDSCARQCPFNLHWSLYLLNCKCNSVDPSISSVATAPEKLQHEGWNYICIILMGTEDQAQYKDEILINGLCPDTH